MGLGGFAPTVGIIGTVVSLTHVLANLGKPDELGPLIASAFVATLWGLLTANFMWLPIGGKLRKLAQLESDRQTLLMEGLLAVQAGSQPRLLGERLKAMVPPAARADTGGKGGKAGKKADAADDQQLAA
jgi:chemotaxis protein MotA